jgi:hypothetical protein
VRRGLAGGSQADQRHEPDQDERHEPRQNR